MSNCFVGDSQLRAHAKLLIISHCGQFSTAAVALTFQEHSSTCSSQALHYHHPQMMHQDTEIKWGILARVCRQGLSLYAQQSGERGFSRGQLGNSHITLLLLWITFWKSFSLLRSLYLLNLRGPASGCSCFIAEVLQADQCPALPSPTETVIPAKSSKELPT